MSDGQHASSGGQMGQAYGQPGPPPGCPPQRRTRVGVVVTLGAVVVVGLTVRGLGHLKEQDAGSGWSTTSMVRPASLLAFPRQPRIEQSEQVKALSSQLAALRGMKAEPAVAAYGRGPTEPPMMVVGGIRAAAPLTAAEQTASWEGVVKGITRAGGSVTLAERDAGVLGGRTGCGSVSNGTLLCLSVDAAGMVIAIGSQSLPGGLDALATVRQQIEIRT